MPLADLTCLVVEDNEFQRRWLVAMLSNLGANRIVEADDGLAGLAILQDPQAAIDICFIDLNMPGMDGMELIRHMARSANPVSIVLSSALDPSLVFSVESMSQAYGVNLLGTITKPATPEELTAIINRYTPRDAGRTIASQVAKTVTLEEILQGLQEDQFTPYFQPKVELATGKVKGVEAFARWEHPEHGIIAADAFIPVLEAGGKMDQISWNMIRKSAATCRMLHDAGHPVPISINLASQPLSELEFADHFAACMAAHGIEPSFITIEITESASRTETPVFLENLARLRMKGFMLAVDDYGTGDASMQEQLRIPFSELKIDRSFVVGASHNEALGLALASCLELAQKLKRESTAVGVETRQDWDFLQKLGCTNAQGYFIAKPMDAKALPGWIEEWSQFF
ncbi:EAL domain-containing protein (putative c-di-GMP-specific phosphodiesterase class I) [Paucimonas lemoignei]|uniref:EAL domain-containing protein (Putative c-di-GMP-specific phosphodiesterase class I) n=1 Tax=Paucimonas lemoignei TaxID=29443 RepID=A0A4R3HRK9_PAULE|nr:EAL domain-containing response regulator [Paucimonas lemoignei]TCS35756.1 EAL domain-containing protein (putative c-di-GMP-specific phosphodiesterase class I) [Paucimonas lemoignei]